MATFSPRPAAAKARLTDDEPMFERSRGGLNFASTLKAHGPNCISCIG